MLPRAVTLAVLLAVGVPSIAADKPESWIEVRSPHFRVISNAGERQGRRAAGQFERFREVLQKTLTRSKVDSATPMLILAVKDENSLKTLLPQYWEKKGSTHPAGYFLRSMGKNFVVLRLDATGENPYQIIYHEYTHSIMWLNFQALPLWVSEGLAEFFGHATIQDQQAGTGQPSTAQLMRLRENRLLPLTVLISADHHSPYYNEADKTSLFYAQSWALTHYLMIGDKGVHRQQLIDYLTLVASGMPDVEAAQRAFGDLKQFEKNLEHYIHLALFYYLPVKLGVASDEKQYSVRSISDAEALASRGDFLMHSGRFAEGRPMLEEALRRDPNQGIAQESLGFYYFRQGDREEAAKHFSAAVRLDSANYLAHFYYATLSAASPSDGETDNVEIHLRKAIELNPDFVPAYSTLAGYYALRGIKLEAALQLALKAARLEPGVLSHQVNVASVLLRMGHVDEAIRVAQRGLAAAQNDQDRAMMDSFLLQASRQQEFLAQKKRYEEESAASQKKWEEEKARREQEQKAGQETERQNEVADQKESKPGQSQAGASRSPLRHLIVKGKVGEVTCGPPASMLLALSAGDKSVILHANNYFKIDYLSLGWKPPDDFQPCLHLSGLTLKVTYNPVEGKPYIGEILSIEVQQ